MYPEITVKSSDIYTFDTLYNKIIEQKEIREHGFFKLVVTNRECAIVTMEDKMRKMVLKTHKLHITADRQRGIYRYISSPCPGRTLENFYQQLEDDQTLPSDSPKLPNSEPSMRPKSAAAPIPSNRKRKLIKSSKGKNKLIDNQDAEHPTNATNPSWRKMPLFNINRSTLSPLQFIETYWESHRTDRPQRYAFEWDITLFNDEIKKLNLRSLWNPIDQLYLTNAMAQGVNRSMVLVSGPDTAFPWHNEDLDLSSINYMHWGATKIWVFVHHKSTDKFREALIRDFGPTEENKCKNPVKHKNYLTDVKWLMDNEIEYSIVPQNPGEYIVVLPNIFHSGYNTGLCINEAMNFVCPLWWEEYRKGHQCDCKEREKKKVVIDLSSFQHSGQLNLNITMVAEELNQNINIEKEAIDDVSHTESQIISGKSIEQTNDVISEEKPIGYTTGGPLPVADQSNIDVNKSIDPIENIEEDPLLIIEQPNPIPHIDVNKTIDEAEGIDNEEVEEKNQIFIDGLPERNMGGRPAHGPLVCHMCGHKENQTCRMRAHIDGHSVEKKYKCEWIDKDGIVCDKKYKKQKQLTEHQRLKNHKNPEYR